MTIEFVNKTWEIFADLLNTDKPDERQIMTYVSCYYHAFQGAMQVKKYCFFYPLF